MGKTRRLFCWVTVSVDFIEKEKQQHKFAKWNIGLKVIPEQFFVSALADWVFVVQMFYLTIVTDKSAGDTNAIADADI